jgi:hypothetical protein
MLIACQAPEPSHGSLARARVVGFVPVAGPERAEAGHTRAPPCGRPSMASCKLSPDEAPRRPTRHGWLQPECVTALW